MSTAVSMEYGPANKARRKYDPGMGNELEGETDRLGVKSGDVEPASSGAYSQPANVPEGWMVQEIGNRTWKRGVPW